MPQGLADALVASAVEPARGLEMMQALRAQAIARGDLRTRLAVDQAECLIRSDVDSRGALALADAGLAAAGADPQGPPRESWLLPRACRAAVVAERGDHEAAKAEFEALLSMPADRSTERVRAMTLRERGVTHAAVGDHEAAQRDLIAACDALKALGEARELRTCIGHLAHHHRRMGDAEEALRLVVPLRDELRSLGATYDDALYTHLIGGVLQTLSRWEESLQPLREAARAMLAAADTAGAGAAEHLQAIALSRLGRSAEALDAIDKALAHLQPPELDPREYIGAELTRAQILLALGRVADARAQLGVVQPRAQNHQEAAVRLRWLRTQAPVLAEAGRWREAYASLLQAQDLLAERTKQQLSQQSARMRMAFNRQRDAEELASLRRLNEQGQRLRRTQAAALVLFVILLAVAATVAVRKVRQAGRLQALASTDELTGLPNRRSLLASLQELTEAARRDQQPLSVLMIDVDHFKHVNDSFGHEVGDAVLRHLARTLMGGLREQDRLGRIGGEEFVVLLPGTAAATAIKLAERLRAAVQAFPLARTEGDIPVTVSIGVTACAGGQRSPTQLLAEADEALYEAKHAGRNNVRPHPRAV